MSDQFFWPREGDELFAGGEDWENNACVGFTAERWVGYIEGFTRAGDALVRTVAETGRDQDYLVYPIVFLYRHAIELSLKHLIIRGSELHDEDPGELNRHALLPLWRKCRGHLERVCPDGPKEDLDAVDEVLRQFEGRDPRSTTFRYPVDTTGRPSLPENGLINIRNFSEVANRVLTLLDGCRCELGLCLDYKRLGEQGHW